MHSRKKEFPSRNRSGFPKEKSDRNHAENPVQYHPETEFANLLTSESGVFLQK